MRDLFPDTFMSMMNSSYGVVKPKSKKTLRPKYQFLQDRESEAAANQSRRHRMRPWNGRDEPDFEVKTPWNGKA